MKNGAEFNKSRRNFFKSIATALVVLPMLQACKQKAKQWVVKLTGTRHVLGHRLWSKDFPAPTAHLSVPIVIVGGGVTGLSAARQLHRKGHDDFLLLEMEDHVGGNASNGENTYTKYPLGAHYLPLPNREDHELIAFLKESKILKEEDQTGLLNFDETQMVFAPNERIYYRNAWHEGLIPKSELSANDEAQFAAFFQQMEYYRSQKTAGKYWFDIPLKNVIWVNENRALDHMTMREWMEKQWSSSKLFAYVDYCCRDDFGLGIDYVSAYAGIHYFAVRKKNAQPEYEDGVLTWPEGNARLVRHFHSYVKNKTKVNHIVYEVKIKEGGVELWVFDAQKNQSLIIHAQKVIMTTPQFVNAYLFDSHKKYARSFHYAPWLLATLVVSELKDNETYPLCWDNVLYESDGLGYIYDQHQHLNQVSTPKVITYYHSFSSDNCKRDRRLLYQKPAEYWQQKVFNELKKAHPTIEQVTESMTIHRLGHGMISPKPGFITGQARRNAAQTMESRIYFAHTDLSGISIFEEAFHQGIDVVNQLLS
ncbi:MAG: FAD-dependent oxidoreductase [Flavobacterium sp.]|jgi:protoporphyrinogen oxidase|uniref:FAD-dependent oxidoreductase n=1 Tax=Flavobacterium sp. TaxID=239 RepID=UPI0022C1AD14|nr:FAD-dependent oxidoreductase [Flavobacterium sp.]MCZ8297280.1 FAD-dependent oxidoreductase [Flavobacterium sp.]